MKKLCPEALNGAAVEMVPDKGGAYRCRDCGASEAQVKAAYQRRQDEWSGRLPRPFLGRLWASLRRRIWES